MKRRLAAIMAADVVGYSRLMGEDEAKMFAALSELRDALFDPLIADRDGNIVKRMGDGWLVEFSNVSDAVVCAMEIQQGLINHETIKLRIGVHVGDITSMDNDVYGDGVNVAARLEAVANPGQVLISDTALNSLDGKTAQHFSGGINRNLKNISRPIPVWHWPDNGSALPMQARTTNEQADRPEKPSIAVLAFDNMSRDPEQEFFSDGITEDIITDLSKVSGLIVIARNSSFSYKNRALDVRQICRELDARFVLEGSVRRAGDKVRISAQLINGLTGAHVWADRFDRSLEDIFAVQDEITREIVDALKVALTPTEQTGRGDRHRVDPKAYECLIRGRTLFYSFTAEALMKSRAEFKQAIELDPGLSAAAFSGLSMIETTEHFNGWNGAGPDRRNKALELARKAVAEDDQDALAHHALAVALNRDGQFEDAARAAEQAIAIDPNSAGATSMLATTRDFAGRHDEAIELFKRSLRLDPKYDVALQLLGRTFLGLGRNSEAESCFRKRLTMVPQSDMARLFLAALYGLEGRSEEAHKMWSELLEVNPDFSFKHFQSVIPRKDVDWYRMLTDGLRAEGLID